MAQTYEVYLRNRLTEFDIVIRNLPYRDGLVVHAKMYLDAMVNYLYLQKYIVGEHNASLRLDIDNMLERIFNTFKNHTELQFDAEMVANKPINISSDLTLYTSEVSVREEIFNAYSEFMQLSTAALKYDIQKSIGTGKVKMALTTKAAHTLKTAFEKFNRSLALDTYASSSAEGFATSNMELQLLTEPFDIYYLMAIQCEAFLNLSCAMDYEIWFSLGSAKSEFYLNAQIGDIGKETFCSATSLLRLLSEVNATLTSFIVPSDGGINLIAVIEAGLKRYRKVSEVDPIAVSNLDAVGVDELDYVVLA